MRHEANRLVTMEASSIWKEPHRLPIAIENLTDDLFRKNVSGTGFALVDLGPNVDLLQFRSILIGFAAALDEIYQRSFSRRLVLRSMGRFDQHKSTEAHLDGAPDESIIMLGYEPTDVPSRLFVLDYTKCAVERGLDPKTFLAQFNPTSKDGRALLEGYCHEVRPFNSRHFRIVMINNSSRPLDSGAEGMLGVLHQSLVQAAPPGGTRYINTLLLSPGHGCVASYAAFLRSSPHNQ
ncbi:MAG TPA: hypothetical protein VFC78_11110 [Tepidisphaeraceae bacterium]|nr:hypothetical protein [Tepidisphaeraceae bacterium]